MRLVGIFGLTILLTAASAFGNDGSWRELRKNKRDAKQGDISQRYFPAKGELSSASRMTMISGGIKRSYLIQSPKGSGPFPVILLLHGGTQSGEKVWTQTSLPTLAARQNYILVAPDGINEQWNDGRGITMSGKRSSVDDVGFLRALVQKVIRENNGDASRVFITGASNGGEMTYRMLCDASDLFATAASFIATMPVALSQSCKPSHPVKLLLTFGTDDPLMNYAGGTTNKKGKETVPMLSADATVNFWRQVNGCQSTTTTFNMPDLNPQDGSTVQRSIYSSCSSGQTVGSMIVLGGGHSWPNGPSGSWLVQKIIGPTNRDIDAGQELMKFFENRSQ